VVQVVDHLPGKQKTLYCLSTAKDILSSPGTSFSGLETTLGTALGLQRQAAKQ
jgi:hypothetical protein